MELQSDITNIIKQEELNTIEQIKQSFDSILSKFDENKNFSKDITSMKEIVQLVFHSNEKYFYESDFINHRVFVILRDWYLNLLQQWRHDAQLDDASCFIFDMIPNLFIKMSNHMSDNNISILKELILHEPLLNELNKCLEEIASNGKYLQDPKIKSIDTIFRVIQRLERNRLDNKTNPLLIKLFDNSVKCICSSSFIQILIQSTTQENDDAGQKFLLHTCTDYIYSHSIDQQHKQSLLDIRRSLLRPFSQWLTQQSSFFRLWNSRMSVILRQLCFILTLNIQLNRYANFDKDTFDYYCQLIDSFVNILYSIIQTENPTNNKLALSLIGTLTPNLYTMTLSNQLEKYIKSKHITSLILKLIDIENDEIQLNTFRILSSIITEQDTKNISNSNNIAKISIKFLNKVIDDSNKTLRFYNLLRSLKNLIQYDQIKNEITKQNGIPLLLRSAIETKIKSLQAQQPALEILLALTFNKEAHDQLKGNLIHIKPLLSSPHQGVSRAVDGLIWRLEKQEEALIKSRISDITYKYDIIISYSHSDKELTYHIYDQLIKDNFRVWIDRDETFETTMITKANIINQSKYILICMSNEYKQSSYCRCEAYYAYEHQCQIIPLILILNYHPDGWLSDIINGKIYIDFVKFDFELAYSKLKNEINRSEIYPKIEEQISSFTKVRYSSVIDQWTKDDVKSFLIENKFNSLLPIISEMNGYLLHELYIMCKANQESMFHTLKNEILLLDKNFQPLTLFIYLRFLNEIKKYIPSVIHHSKY